MENAVIVEGEILVVSIVVVIIKAILKLRISVSMCFYKLF